MYVRTHTHAHCITLIVKFLFEMIINAKKKIYIYKHKYTMCALLSLF